MTKETMIRNYRNFSGADSYIIGFIYKHELYAIELDEIMPRLMTIAYSSSKTGHQKKLQLVIKKKNKEQLIRKGATNLGSEMLVENEGNRGFAFERLVYKLNGQEPRPQDNVGFWVGGDININGREVQVKLDGAQIVQEKTLKNLQKKSKKDLTK